MLPHSLYKKSVSGPVVYEEILASRKHVVGKGNIFTDLSVICLFSFDTTPKLDNGRSLLLFFFFFENLAAL